MGESIASWQIIGVHFQNNESKNCYVQQNEPRMELYMSSISLHSSRKLLVDFLLKAYKF